MLKVHQSITFTVKTKQEILAGVLKNEAKYPVLWTFSTSNHSGDREVQGEEWRSDSRWIVGPVLAPTEDDENH